MQGRIKDGAIVGQDFSRFVWYNSNCVFDLEDFTQDRFKATTYGFGKPGSGSYGNGALFVKKKDVELISEDDSKLQTSDVLHILRNPHGWSEQQIKQAQLQACDEIENWEKAYENLSNWCRENGLDITTRNI
jgi:hypothetical protein